MLRGATSPFALALAAMLLALMGGLGFSTPVDGQDRLPPAPYAYRQLDDQRLEQQARDLMHALRCIVCQGQSIADSDAPLAGDMRSQVRERLLAGESPDAIRAFLVSRYGHWVDYDPPFAAQTAILFIGPILALLAGGWLAFARFRRAPGVAPDEGAAG